VCLFKGSKSYLGAKRTTLLGIARAGEYEGKKHPVKCIIRSRWMAPDVSSLGKCCYSYSFSRSYFGSSLGGAEMLCFASAKDLYGG
jgi:hypothetical protein